jgi:hypothetical protein
MNFDVPNHVLGVISSCASDGPSWKINEKNLKSSSWTIAGIFLKGVDKVFPQLWKRDPE